MRKHFALLLVVLATFGLACPTFAADAACKAKVRSAKSAVSSAQRVARRADSNFNKAQRKYDAAVRKGDQMSDAAQRKLDSMERTTIRWQTKLDNAKTSKELKVLKVSVKENVQKEIADWGAVKCLVEILSGQTKFTFTRSDGTTETINLSSATKAACIEAYMIAKTKQASYEAQRHAIERSADRTIAINQKHVDDAQKAYNDYAAQVAGGGFNAAAIKIAQDGVTAAQTAVDTAQQKLADAEKAYEEAQAACV